MPMVLSQGNCLDKWCNNDWNLIMCHLGEKIVLVSEFHPGSTPITDCTGPCFHILRLGLQCI